MARREGKECEARAQLGEEMQKQLEEERRAAEVREEGRAVLSDRLAQAVAEKSAAEEALNNANVSSSQPVAPKKRVCMCSPHF